MSKKRIGRAQIGECLINVVAQTTATGGEFTSSNKSKTPEMTIGLGYEDWEDVLSTAFHEALEVAASQLNARYSPDLSLANDSGDYVFMMSHTVFSEAVGRAAWFVCEIEGKLKEAWLLTKEGK